MTEGGKATPGKPVIARDLGLADLRAALIAGWNDFRAEPAFGLFFGAIFCVAGIALTYFLVARGEFAWAIPAAAAFPLIAPFTAVSLYEVSRRREMGQPMSWSAFLGAIKGRGDEQILAMGVIIFVAFGFWVIVAHVVFSIALVESGSGSESLEFLMSDAGVVMLLAGSVIGGVMALVFYVVTVFSLPMLVDRQIDFVTASFASVACFNANRGTLLAWAAIIAIALIVSLVVAFVGLLITIPVFGHATWHLYRRAII